MRIRTPGKIHDQLWFLGQEGSCVYMLEGRNGSMLINGGMNCIVGDILDQFVRFGIDETRIRHLLILHSHFDHVGIVPFFKRRHPEMVIHASQRSLEVLRKPKAIAAINEASRYVLESRGLGHLPSVHDLEWRSGMSGEPVHDGDCIDLGDMEVRIIETPGHSPCSISAYVPQLKALFPSDGGGIPIRDRINVYGTSDYTLFEASLRKLAGLELNCLCADHYGFVIGDEARTFIADAARIAAEKRRMMEEAYRRTGGVETAAWELANRFHEDNSDSIVPPDVFVESYRQMIKHVVGLKR